MLYRIEQTEFLIRKRVSFDSVAMKGACMRRQTRENRRTGITLRPIEHLREQVPIRFLAQTGMLGFGSRDDHAVKTLLPEVVEGKIEAIQVSLAAVSSWYTGKRIQFDVNGQIVRSVLQQLEEL